MLIRIPKLSLSQNRDKANEMPLIPEQTLKFVFEQSVSLIASPAIRFQATKCLQALSSSALSQISQYFVGKMGQVKEEEDERAFVYVQRALTELRWGLGSRYDATFAFLSALYEFMNNRVERGVLKMEICSSIAVFMKRLLSERAFCLVAFDCSAKISHIVLATVFLLPAADVTTDEGRHLIEELQGFEARASVAPFWTLFEKIYVVIAKWRYEYPRVCLVFGHADFMHDLHLTAARPSMPCRHSPA